MGCLFSRKKSHSDYHPSERGYISRVDVHSSLSGSYANGDSYASHRSCTTGSWSTAPSRSSAATKDVNWASTKGHSAGGVNNKHFSADSVMKSASHDLYIKSTSSKGFATATAASVDLESNSSESKRRRIMTTYITDGGGKVAISVPLNPWKVLGLHSSGVSREAVKEAFKMKITQPVRQNRAMISIAYHMLTSSAGRYKGIHGTDEFLVGRRDHFMLAACGHTEELALMIAKNANLVEERDEQNRTLLYIACRSGFYDMCKFLLQKGASVNEVQCDDSTPLHGAAYFGHALVVGLLLQYGARSDISNKWGTAQDESATPMIRSLIQTASADSISSLTAKLRVKQLVLSVRLIEYQGKVIAKELVRDPRTLDARTRAEWNGIQSSWETAWHGTRYDYLESIIEKGLLPAGSSDIKPMNGHISLGETYLGISNWAAAIFVSPSILYAAHALYSERIFSESQQWCVLVKVYCKPGSYKSYDPTVIKYDPMDGEPENVEYRVPVTEKDKNVILRVETTRSIVVRSLMFVRLNFLENQDMNFAKAMELFR